MLGNLFPVPLWQLLWKPLRRRARRLAGPLLGVVLAGAGFAGAQTSPSHPAATAAVIEGFREAHFGMTEAQVRQAIRKDFPTGAGPVAVAVHPTEKTTILSLTAADLLPDTGPARISYILGYRSKQLIQINLVWTSDGKTAASDQSVVGAANALRDYFASQNFKPESVVRNQKVAEGAVLVFRAADAAGRMLALVLAGEGAAARHGQNPPPPLTLELSYIADSGHPDIFKIGKGQF